MGEAERRERRMLTRPLRLSRSCATEEAEAGPGKDLSMIDPVLTN